VKQVNEWKARTPLGRGGSGGGAVEESSGAVNLGYTEDHQRSARRWIDAAVSVVDVDVGVA
jgi:hypothetical protein